MQGGHGTQQLAHGGGCRCEGISQPLQKEEQTLTMQMRKETGFWPREGLLQSCARTVPMSQAGVTGGGACAQGLAVGTQVLEACHFLWDRARLEGARGGLCIFKKTSFSTGAPSEKLLGSFLQS